MKRVERAERARVRILDWARACDVTSCDRLLWALDVMERWVQWFQRTYPELSRKWPPDTREFRER